MLPDSSGVSLTALVPALLGIGLVRVALLRFGVRLLVPVAAMPTIACASSRLIVDWLRPRANAIVGVYSFILCRISI